MLLGVTPSADAKASDQCTEPTAANPGSTEQLIENTTPSGACNQHGLDQEPPIILVAAAESADHANAGDQRLPSSSLSKQCKPLQETSAPAPSTPGEAKIQR